MGAHTLHLVQSFTVNQWGEFSADALVKCRSASDALRLAARAHDAGKPSLVFSRVGDEKIGEYDEPNIIARLGEIPNELVEICLLS